MEINNKSRNVFVTNFNVTILEDNNTSVKVAFATVSVILAVFSVVALFALNKTRHTPKTARFLSSGLITYDTLAVIFYSARKFITNGEVNIIISVIGACFNFLAYITVGVMSLERLIIFYSPHFYIKHMTAGKVRLYVWLIWLAIIVSYTYVRFGACYFAYKNMTLYDVVGKCNKVSFLYYEVFIWATVVLSVACYIKIFLIVKSEKHFSSNKRQSISATARHLQNYKSTSLVFMYLLTVILSATAYTIIFFLNLDTVKFRLSIDVLNMTSCMIDPCMYVFWYSECRMEIMKILQMCIPSLTSRIEKMRINVFHIVTSESCHLFQSNKVGPSNAEDNMSTELVSQI